MSRKQNAVLIERARQFRREMTGAEGRLWSVLCGGRLGVKFRRQHPIDQFIADFCCVEHQLIIEADGAVHATQGDRDEARTNVLQALGYRVLQFTNAQIEHDLVNVLAQIQQALK